ncbi:MAG: hypothetical protein L6R40_001539 [Gallowayella cf. fulva]|nr:MAG: hypothetical protein L6R40_001539 [Xanthomendoza cf. fulva]
MVRNETEWRQQVDAWLMGPASPPPPGVTSNLLGGPSLRKYDVLCQAFCLTVVTTLVVVRMYTKGTAATRYFSDSLAFGIIIAEADGHGSGKHIWDVRGRDLMEYNKLSNAAILTYTLAILFTKVSILLLYLRIFTPTRSVRYIIHITLWANVLFYIACFFVAIFICNPRDTLWNPYVEHAECGNSAAAKVVSAVFNVISDFTILVIPISTVWKLQMQRKKRWWTIGIFASGLLYAEISAGIICGCMPAAPAFCRYVLDRIVKKRASPSDQPRSEEKVSTQRLRPMDEFEMAETGSGYSLHSRQVSSDIEPAYHPAQQVQAR